MNNTDPHQPARRRRSIWAATAAVLLLAACGGGGVGPTTVQIDGLAATGAAIPNAIVTAVNASGQTATATTAASGAFTLTISDGAPFVLKISDSGGRVWYSFAQGAGTAHITPLTTLALAHAWGGRPLADLYNGWASTRVTAAQVLEAARVVNANLAATMQARGVDPVSINIFNAPFSANNLGLDAVLDAMRLSFNCAANLCNPVIGAAAGGTLVAWNGGISVAGISLSWSTTSSGAGAGSGSSGGSGGGSGSVPIGACTTTPTAGTWSMRVQTTISGLGGGLVPEVCIDGLAAKPASQADFCGGSLASNQLPTGVTVVSCSYDGTVGTIAARISTPITLDYTIKYTFFQR